MTKLEFTSRTGGDFKISNKIVKEMVEFAKDMNSWDTEWSDGEMLDWAYNIISKVLEECGVSVCDEKDV